MCGMDTGMWIELWSLCHEGSKRIEWPDGRPAIKQPTIVVNMFYMILQQVMAENESNGK